MGTVTVFYSWQSDKPQTRSLVENALEEAIARARATLKVDLILDQDSRDESGSPKIPDFVQKKIRQAVVFVADLTIVASREKRGGLPNGCVSVEWGWAEAFLGPSALVGAMNTEYGEPNDLPVDIRQTLVRTLFSLKEGSSEDESRVVLQELTDHLEQEIILAVQARFFHDFHSEAPPAIQYLVTSSPDGWRQRDISFAALAQDSGISEDAATAAMEDLVRFGMAETIPTSGKGFSICCLPSLYAHFDPLFMGWNSDQDAASIAQDLVKHERSSTEDVSKRLGMSARQLNPALFRLLQGGFAEASGITRAESPFYRLSIRKNSSTRAFAEGRGSLPLVAPRA
jgi:hypothetical protein